MVRHSGLGAPTSSGFRSGTRDARVACALFHFSKFTFYYQVAMSAREGPRKVRLYGTAVRWTICVRETAFVEKRKERYKRIATCAKRKYLLSAMIVADRYLIL